MGILEAAKPALIICTELGSVRKFQQDPTFNLIGRPRGPRMKFGWGCVAQLTCARCARTSQYARSGRRPPSMWTAGGIRELDVDARRDRG